MAKKEDENEGEEKWTEPIPLKIENKLKLNWGDHAYERLKKREQKTEDLKKKSARKMLQIVLEDSLRCVKCATMNAFFLGSDALKKEGRVLHTTN